VATPKSFNDGSFVFIANATDLAAVITAVEESAFVGLDLETTGLDPRADRARLLALCVDTVDGSRCTYLIDCFTVHPAPLWGCLAATQVVGHNLIFDLQFLARLGFEPGQVHDTLVLSQVLYGAARSLGTAPVRHTLKECAHRELGVALAKDLQTSNWAGSLSAEQLAYAAADAAILEPLYQVLASKLKAAGLDGTAVTEAAGLPCVAWMSEAGVQFDRSCWENLAAAAVADARRMVTALDAAAPPRPGTLFPESWNWDSPEQARQALALAGCPVESTRDGVLAAQDHPLASLLRDYRDARKRETTYGMA